MGWARSIPGRLHDLGGCLLLTEMHPWPLPTVLGFDVVASREPGLVSVRNQAVLDQVSASRRLLEPGTLLTLPGVQRPSPRDSCRRPKLMVGLKQIM